ncbi:hypothetical protein CHH28_12225 [Bacterioplanes sanyensis]|uniref:Uncharacterized protein n=1 Tax=Bacterioplanes sanyensis TaxID=1249553 RepID=A0A222FLX8_9GAMM|nr:hypothetical protein CHH28_12225 [Bacterioplanes sanyensis]
MAVGVDKGYDTGMFVDGFPHITITPHVAAKPKNGRLDDRAMVKLGYHISQIKRKRVEEPFGWVGNFG